MNLGKNHTNDQFYRYKMPFLETVIHGEKRKMTNLPEISKAVDRPESMILKHLSADLGVAISDFKMSSKISKDQIQESIKKFVEIYVMCPTCENPETDIYKGNRLKCRACGAKNPINGSDKMMVYLSKM